MVLFDTTGSIRSSAVRSGVTLAAGWGLVLTLIQISLAVILAGARTGIDGYYRLFQADSGWYQNIVENGYASPPVLTAENFGNVAFFPGYPLLVSCVMNVFGLETRSAALIASQSAAWVFWTYLLLFFQRWQAPARLCVLGVLLVATHPSAFFLVTAYSEPLFLAGTLGFLYWTNSARRGSFLLAAMHGFVMTGTRLVGVPLVIFPLLLVCLRLEPSERPHVRAWLRALSLGAIASLGAFFFLAYCAWKFGAWDLYAQTEKTGWGVAPHYWGLFSLGIFHVHWPHLREPLIDPDFISRLSVPVALLLFVAAALAEWRLSRRMSDSGWRFRLSLYLCAFFLLYVPVAAHFTRGMSSMTRFALCVQALLALAAVHFVTRANLDVAWRRRLGLAFGAWCALCFALQLMLTWRFVHGIWVA
jgi:hypothetical protein